MRKTLKDYGLTVETYQVSYQQIYAWVRKYEEKGVKGLTDRRGEAKPEDELTEEDHLRHKRCGCEQHHSQSNAVFACIACSSSAFSAVCGALFVVWPD